MNTLQVIALVLLGVSVTAAYIYTETKYKGAHRRNNAKRTNNTQGDRDFLETTKIVRPDFTSAEHFKRTGESRRPAGSAKGSDNDTRKESER